MSTKNQNKSKLDWNQLSVSEKNRKLIKIFESDYWNTLGFNERKLILLYSTYSDKQLLQRYLYFDAEWRRLKGYPKSLTKNWDGYGHPDEHPIYCRIYETYEDYSFLENPETLYTQEQINVLSNPPEELIKGLIKAFGFGNNDTDKFRASFYLFLVKDIYSGPKVLNGDWMSNDSYDFTDYAEEILKIYENYVQPVVSSPEASETDEDEDDKASTSEPEYTESELKKKTVKELKKIAKIQGKKGYSKMKKTDLINFIKS